MDRFSNRWVLISAFALLACASPLALAKNVVIQGERGTRWCCPDGKKGPDCKQFPAGVPLGADCKLNIVIAPDPSITPTQAPVRDSHELTLKPVAEKSTAPVRSKEVPARK
ncbi:hypothetical protein [Lysobacter sp. Root983]|uniref:hypothetical protein n=1 Tax=Lysobacter sp. Root983 TaxID=1736613 RepID=UPI00070BBF8E|nr:hypothetical protein [Lysobacter sp. Root983]KRD76841.1 hypothetical protein ASE43_06530 [Lysobacter sp. Root983]